MSQDRHGYPVQSLGKGAVSRNGHGQGMDYIIWSLGMRAMLGQLECSLGISYVTVRALTQHGRYHRIGHDCLSCRHDMGYVTEGALRYEHQVYGRSMSSWHVVCAWSVSNMGHRRDMGYVTWWAPRGDHLAFM